MIFGIMIGVALSGPFRSSFRTSASRPVIGYLKNGSAAGACGDNFYHWRKRFYFPLFHLLNTVALGCAVSVVIVVMGFMTNTHMQNLNVFLLPRYTAVRHPYYLFPTCM